MRTFFDLVRLSVGAIWPMDLLAGVVLAVVARNRARSGATAGPPLRLLLFVLAAPLVVTMWASATYGAERGARPGELGSASAVLTALTLGVLALLVWVQWRWRTAWFPALVCIVVALVATAVSWFVGAMAIADDWI